MSDQTKHSSCSNMYRKKVMNSPLAPLPADSQRFPSCFRPRRISNLYPTHSSPLTKDVALETTASRTRVYPHSSSGKRSWFRNIFFKVTWTDNGVVETQVILKACQGAVAGAGRRKMSCRELPCERRGELTPHSSLVVLSCMKRHASIDEKFTVSLLINVWMNAIGNIAVRNKKRERVIRKSFKLHLWKLPWKK